MGYLDGVFHTKTHKKIKNRIGKSISTIDNAASSEPITLEPEKCASNNV